MARPRTSNLRHVARRRADGSVVHYFYNRQTGAFVAHDRDEALAKLLAEQTEAVTDRTGTVAALITDYRADSKYQELAPRTKALYEVNLRQIQEQYGELPVASIREQHIQAIKNRLAAQPTKANAHIALWRIMLGLAKRNGQIRDNPAARPGRLKVPQRTEVWSHADEDRFLAAARPSLRLAFLLLLYTVQRPSDVLAMTSDRVSERDGRLFIALRQAKTGTLIDVPVHRRIDEDLRARLATVREAERKLRLASKRAPPPALLVPSPTGLPWAYRNFARAWDGALDKADAAQATGIDGSEDDAAPERRQRRDLRRTGIVRMAEAGATTPQIAAVSGHAIDYCQRILDTYLPRTAEVALGAMDAWERHGAAAQSKIVELAAERRRRG